MKQSRGSLPKTRPLKNIPSQPAPSPLHFFNTQNPSLRLGLVLALLGAGFYLIETPTSVGRCVLGIVLWALAVSRLPFWFPAVPGIPAFSQTPLQNPVRLEPWSWGPALILGGLVWGLLGASDHYIQTGNWVLVTLFLFALGAILIRMEKRSTAFGCDPYAPPFSPGAAFPFPWALLAIVLVGSFFLFYGWDLYPIGRDNNSLYNLEISDSYLFPNGRTSPYVDGWTWGNPALPFFLIGVFFKVVGSSPAWGTLFIALFNLAGYLFFYGFLRFYLSRPSALAATLLFSSCHWVFYFARETSAGGQLVPFECATLFYLAKSVEGGKSRDFAILGTLMACLWMVAVQGRILDALYVVILAVIWMSRRRGMALQKKSWMLAGAIAFLWYLPMFLYYLHRTHSFGIGAEEIGREAAWGNGKFFIPWGYIQRGLQMFNYRTVDSMTANLPRLSPWEALFLLAGFAWCLWRLFNPAFLLLVAGFFAGLAPAVFSNNPTVPPRALAIAPFAYLLVGIGLDRMGSVVAAPLGSRGRTLRYFFFALILAFSLQWQFDVFFHQMPRDKNTYSVDGSDQDGQRFLVCNLLTKYHNWETLEDASWVLNQSPEGGFIHTLRDLDTFAPFRRIYWPAWSGLPLKNVPPKAKGAVLILGDDTGKAFQDWIDYYYPGAHSGTVSNNFQDIQIRFWEITPDQVQQALNLHPGPPLTGLILGWYDPQNRLLGQRQIPTLATGYLLNDYFRDDPDEPAFPWNKVVSFKAKGRLNCKGMAWVLKTNGRVDGSFGGKPFHCVGLATGSQFNLPLPAQGWVPFEFRYTLPQPGVFDLGFSQRSPTGWDLVPASQLKP